MVSVALATFIIQLVNRISRSHFGHRFNMASAASSLSAPGDRSGSMIGTAIAFIVLSTVAVVLRFSSRVLAKKVGLWWDDWLGLAAWVCFLYNLFSTFFTDWGTRSMFAKTFNDLPGFSIVGNGPLGRHHVCWHGQAHWPCLFGRH